MNGAAGPCGGLHHTAIPVRAIEMTARKLSRRHAALYGQGIVCCGLRRLLVKLLDHCFLTF